MNVIDSSAWLSYFAGDENSDFFAEGIEKSDGLIVPSITITEVFKHILRRCDEASALVAIAHMKEGEVIGLGTDLAISAASYGVMYKLPLADSIIYATAQKYNGVVWTQDADFKNLEGVKFRSKSR